MKKLLVIIVLCCVATVYAAVQLSFSIPDKYVSRVMAALTACENTHVSIHFQGSRDPNDPNKPDFTLDVDYRMDEIVGESSAVYGKRFIRTMVYEIVRFYETKLRDESVKAQIDAIVIPDVNVPDGIIQ